MLYFFCAFAENGTGTGYSEVQMFTTTEVVTLPAVLTLPATDISQTAARLGGEVMSDGNSPILSKGFYWGVPMPTLPGTAPAWPPPLRATSSTTISPA